MKNVILLLLLLSTGYYAVKLQETREKLAEANSTKTTDYEREEYGASCVDWLNKQMGEPAFKLALARSWKKNGQMVFEVIPASEEDWKIAREKFPGDETLSILCTYDKQSGMMFPVTGPERDRWMFYE